MAPLGSISDETLASILPVVAYWLYSGFHVTLGSMERYRLHTRKEEKEKNLVSRRQVVLGVLFQQALQVLVSTLLLKLTGDRKRAEAAHHSLFEVAMQFLVAMAVMDTWQYFVHRFVHLNKFLYRHVHSRHHMVVAPYAYGALYNHPAEGLLLDTLGGALSLVASGMPPRTAVWFFTFATVKTVDDHCGLWVPWNPLQILFTNNSAYHDVHHQMYGGKYNFAQPFFVAWDRIMGTYLPYELRRRPEGGYDLRPLFPNKDAQMKKIT